MSTMNGIGVSPGISIGKACVIKQNQNTKTGTLVKSTEEALAEANRFDHAIIMAIKEVKALKENSSSTLSADDIAILETQIEFLGDPAIKDGVTDKINNEKKNANDALIDVIDTTVLIFQNMDDEYMQARAADVRDIGNRIFKHLNDPGNVTDRQFEANTIIIAGDLSPSDTITIDINLVSGFVTQAGSKTSHTAIIARSKGIPAIVGCGQTLNEVKDGDVIIVDGSKGVVLVNPDHQTIDEYATKREVWLQKNNQLKLLKHLPSVSIDGTAIKLQANIAKADDLDDVFENGGEGVGLLRTELLFMNRDSLPDEDEQFEFYKKATLKSKGKPIIIRTIDIGGDKQLSYFGFPVEQNPFLGYRAIRICLDRPELFITQLKAILRASSFGNLKIMFPMISNVQEIREAKKILDQAKAELLKDKIPFNKDIETGIMIEIPSAAVTADILAKEVDFFSIGTNDLCQYTLAVDRMNEKITHLYDPFNPGVLRLISYVIDQAHKHNIHVGMCGEMAADPLATLLLMGMGLTEFSMSAAAIPSIKEIIIKNTMTTAKQIFTKVMEMDNSHSITAYLQEITQ